MSMKTATNHLIFGRVMGYLYLNCDRCCRIFGKEAFISL